ncbi:PREDICTED: regulation of nuclear pre-mRNA domain-containing protein 1B-like isoform X2 [Priapulus caudatus]|uniref:Regulation of nuclear pre-mRNA domain-containing protein 1B-like isoform X2 n=1 Tax=Priapulus caudatus TaxID=37621 RepID=A0ABM1E646_PRICU|nr:PREDICTED: regulation of nuclear pre-mRNA domain-containing protein 1B-like isoform X2 [Priapulus caudatus]
MASFTDATLVKKLKEVNNTQQSIQTLSLWLIHHRKHAKKIVVVWFSELGKAPIARKLTLMYLANDVIQNSKKKGPEFNKAFLDVLAGAVRHIASDCKDEKTLKSVMRIVRIWEERGVYDATFCKQLKKSFEDGSGSLTKETTTTKVPLVKQHRKQKKHKREKSHESKSTPVEPPTSTKKRKLEEVIALTEELVADEEPLDPPDADELVRALEQLEQSASGDAAVREKIASLPPEVSDISLLEKLKDKQDADRLGAQVEAAVSLLSDYNGRLYAELEERRHVSRMLGAFISAQRQHLDDSQKLLQEWKKKLESVINVRKELKSHLQNLPDLTLLPDVTGGLAPLPSAGDLFSL